jgi:membrane protein
MPSDPNARQHLFAAVGLAALSALGLNRRPMARVHSFARDGEAPRDAGGTDPAAGAAHADHLPPGRYAHAPSDIPATGWWQILKRTASQTSEDRLLTEAAGITFYSLLAFIPALAALVSLYGLFADRGSIEQHLQSLQGVIPGGGMDIIEEQVRRLASQETQALGLGLAFSLAVSLWSSNQATKAVFDALNVVYEEKEKRGFVLYTAVTLMFTLGGILFMLLAMGAVVVLPAVLNVVGMGTTAEWLLHVLRWPLLALGITGLLAVLYRYGPSRERAQWRWITWGGAFAAVAWLAVSLGFSWYVASFGNYNATYGSLGAIVGFMTWIWISATVILVGAELNAEMERQTARDTTTGPERPLGSRGARMADRVAKPDGAA